jgi:hypothetical protein
MMERFNTFGMVSAARRDCAYGQADPGNERSYGEKAEVRVFVYFGRRLLRPIPASQPL